MNPVLKTYVDGLRREAVEAIAVNPTLAQRLGQIALELEALDLEDQSVLDSAVATVTGVADNVATRATGLANEALGTVSSAADTAVTAASEGLQSVRAGVGGLLSGLAKRVSGDK